MSEKLTRQELSWLLTQEARGAAERLRKGVQILTKAPPPMTSEGMESISHPKSERPSERPVTLTSAGEEGEGLETTLTMLEGTMMKLAELSGPASGRGRRGRVDLAALLWEVAPDAKVQLEPGEGTEVYGDEAELRRILHVLAGGGNASGVGGAQLVMLKREGAEVKLSVQLGPDTAPISPAERGWLARMAIRYGGRYELDGSSECLVFPALQAEEVKEVQTLRKELEAAKAQGEMYARELAAVFSEEPERSTRPPAAGDIGGPGNTLAAAARLAEALADDVRAIFGPLGAARLKVGAEPQTPETSALLEEVQRALGRGAELLALSRQMSRLASDLAPIEVDLAVIAQDEAALATVAFASRGVVLTIAAGEGPAALVLHGYPAALRAMVAEMLDQALRACGPGDEVRLAVEGGALVVERLTDDGGAPWSRTAKGYLLEIARAHGIELQVTGRRLVARPK
jgi:signal transduction histidine kinase